METNEIEYLESKKPNGKVPINLAFLQRYINASLKVGHSPYVLQMVLP